MKNRMILCLAVFAILLTGCGKNKNQETLPFEETSVAVATTETAAATEVVETTEETIPGVEDSIFDENGNVVTEPTETKGSEETEASTEPKETKPAGGTTVPTQPANSGESETPDSPAAPDPSQPAGGAGGGTGSTEPTESVEQETTPSVSAQTEYEKFHAMSPAEQQAYMESFDSIEAFFEWYEQAAAEYEAAKPPIDVGDGNINLDDIIGGNG